MDVSWSGAKGLFRILDARRILAEEVAQPELQSGSEGFVQAGPREGQPPRGCQGALRRQGSSDHRGSAGREAGPGMADG